MKVNVFVALAKKDKEEEIVTVGYNGRLVEIQRDAFMNRESHMEWETQIQTYLFDVQFVTDPTIPIKLIKEVKK
jgi:hypothetical protein